MALLGFATLPASASPADIDRLVSHLAGDEEIARSEARQLLAREGAAAVPQILPLVGHGNESVWRAASNTLADIAHELSIPGREEERAAATESMMNLLSPEQPKEVKERSLRLLPLIVPEGFSVDPIVRLLSDGDLREKARTCLEEIGTAKACEALCGALDSSDPGFIRAILGSLQELEPESCGAKILELMNSEDPETRIAATRVYAVISNPEKSDSLWKVVARATPETRAEAERAFLSYVEALRGSSALLSGLYARALKEFSDPATRGAALIGLARIDKLDSIDRIVETAASEKGGDLDAPAIAAFESVVGEDSAGALIAAYSKATPSLRQKMLHLFARSGNRELEMFLADQLDSEDPLVRREVLRSLSGSVSLDALVAATLRAEGEERTRALEMLLARAKGYEASGDSDSAGKAFLRVYELAASESTRKAALGGMARNPTADSFEVLLEVVQTGILGEETTSALVRLCRKLCESNDSQAKKRALAELRGRATTTDSVRELIQLSASIGPEENLAKSLGFVTNWSILGPFPWDPQSGFSAPNIGEPAIDISASDEFQGSELRWKGIETRDSLATVDLGTAIGMRDKVTAYGFAEVEAAEETEAEVRAGSDDGIRIWLNGEVVHENLVDRGSDLDQDIAPVRLRKGKNSILVQVTQGAGGWNFRLRFTRPDGTPLSFD